MPFLSSISWSGMPTGGFCQGIRWVTEFGQANGTSPAWARWGISLDRRGSPRGGRPRLGKKAGVRRNKKKSCRPGGRKEAHVLKTGGSIQEKTAFLGAGLPLLLARPAASTDGR